MGLRAIDLLEDTSDRLLDRRPRDVMDPRFGQPTEGERQVGDGVGADEMTSEGAGENEIRSVRGD